ncbi:MAG TPA: PhnD/SsuA/transferrin family substrate-binding protein [Ilumatobacteraceae bacterium]|jgi:ABC-type phosphate/phosphonate transport system substrate-binding protein|nr:PhnD/SsuA/transferrin family substrate-binding protein [Ilumatobacteraceae bacterium]
MSIASLAMYPFEHLRPAYDHFWDSVRGRLTFEAPALDWDTDPLVACRRDDLVLGQTCGWPLVTELASSVRVVGAFDCGMDETRDGTYYSVLVSSSGDQLDEILARPDLVVVANASDSLSGWISLRVATAAAGRHIDAAVWTGSHAASIDAVRDDRAHLAAIDGVTWAHIGTDTLHLVGRGPRIPCLPLVTSRSTTDAALAELRLALGDTVHDPAMAGVCATLKIRDFLVRDLADYEGLSGLAELW